MRVVLIYTGTVITLKMKEKYMIPYQSTAPKVPKIWHPETVMITSGQSN